MEFKKYLIVKVDNVPHKYDLVEPVTVNQLDRFVKIKHLGWNGSAKVETETIINLDIIKKGL